MDVGMEVGIAVCGVIDLYEPERRVRGGNKIARLVVVVFGSVPAFWSISWWAGSISASQLR